MFSCGRPGPAVLADLGRSGGWVPRAGSRPGAPGGAWPVHRPLYGCGTDGVARDGSERSGTHGGPGMIQ